MMIKYAACAFALAVLCGTGVGGGGLFILYLTELCAMETSRAQAVNLVFFICASSAALFVRRKHKRPNYRKILTVCVICVIGALVGGAIRTRLPERVVRVTIGVFLTLSGVKTLFTSKKSPEK